MTKCLQHNLSPNFFELRSLISTQKNIQRFKQVDFSLCKVSSLQHCLVWDEFFEGAAFGGSLIRDQTDIDPRICCFQSARNKHPALYDYWNTAKSSEPSFTVNHLHVLATIRQWKCGCLSEAATRGWSRWWLHKTKAQIQKGFRSVRVWQKGFILQGSHTS